MNSTSHNTPQDAHGPKYTLDIEGKPTPWHADTISVPELRTLLGVDINTGVMIINLDTNEERQLGENETVPLKPGMGFSRRVGFKRG